MQTLECLNFLVEPPVKFRHLQVTKIGNTDINNFSNQGYVHIF